MLLYLPPNFGLVLSDSRCLRLSNPMLPLSTPCFHAPRKRSPIQPPRRFQCLKALPESAAVDSFTRYSGYLFEGGASEAEALTSYDPLKIGVIYRRKPFLLVRRLFQIAFTFGRWFVLRYLDRLLERSDEMFKIRAAELRAILVELGPAYIKIAQAVSSRPDVVPPAYLDELSLLQDRIAPFSTDIAFDTIEKELGLPIDMLFSEISPEPIASASLGQVYQARLVPSGQVVAVKVQRPGVQAAISLDIFILRNLAGLIRRAGKFNTDLQAVVDEWASSLFRVNRIECRRWTTGQKPEMVRNLGSCLVSRMDITHVQCLTESGWNLYGGFQDVFIPKMYLEQSSRRVLIMEWIEGKKLCEMKDLYLIEVGVDCSLTQLLEYGFYHADPHPGNLMRTNDGKLAFLDFGMMGEFKQELRDGFIEACLHLVNRDFDALSRDFVTLGLLPPTAQKDDVAKALTDVFQSAVNKGVRNISFGDLSGNLGRTMYKFKFQIPSYFSLVIRSLAVLEGIAISFDPNYKVLSSSYPWIARKVLTDSSPKLRSTLQALLYKEGYFRIDRLESLLGESLRARIEQSRLKKETVDMSSSVAVKQILKFTLDEKGAFVREVLLQELAKGIDALGLATMDSVTSAAAILPFRPFPSSLMTDEDIINLRTLRRLLILISGLQRNENLNIGEKDLKMVENEETSLEETLLALYQLPSIQEFWPVLSIIPELPPESQQQLLRLPADLAGRLASRAAARTLRRFII